MLDGYGVVWTREALARDVLQNFFDAATDFGEVTVEVDASTHRVLVRGPAEFDLDLLGYVGATTKRDGTTAGGFGEGFKICALVALRDFGAGLRAGSGERGFRAVLDPIPLGKELCYAPETLPGARGSFVELTGCDAALLAAFDAARDLFVHPENGKLGETIASAPGVAFVRSTIAGQGEIYYRRQRRGVHRFYRGPAITLRHDAPIRALEGDRDRSDVPLDPVAEAITAALPVEGVRAILWALEDDWRYGSTMLRAIVRAATARELRFDFPAKYVARDGEDGGLSALAERGGRVLCAGYLAQLGMRRPRDLFSGDLQTRAPTPIERGRFYALRDLYTALAGSPPKHDALEVFALEGAAVLGQHLGDKVIVGAELLHGPFVRAAGTVLHELAHERGGESSPGFLGQLESLIAAAIARPEEVDRAKERFRDAEPVELDVAAAAQDEEEEDAEDLEKKKKDDRHPYVHDGVYAPELAHRRLSLRDAELFIELVVPPAWPPTERVIEALDRVAARLALDVRARVCVVTGPRTAALYSALGLPTLWAGKRACGGPAEPSLSVRLYDHDGEQLPWPTDAELEVWLRSAQTRGSAIERERRARIGAARAAVRREVIGDEAAAAYDAWHAWRERVSGVLEPSPFDHELSGVWGIGCDAARERAAIAAPPGLDAAALRALLKTEVNADRDRVAQFHAAWPRLDDADAFDKGVLWAASGAAMLALEDGEDAARAAYDEVRAMADRALELAMPFQMRGELLRLALDEVGMSSAHYGRRRWVRGAARDALERAIPAALTEAAAYEGVAGLSFGMRFPIARIARAAPDPASDPTRDTAIARAAAVKSAYEAAAHLGPARAAARALDEVLARYDDEPEVGQGDLPRALAFARGDRVTAWWKR
jgi:hypothetical protein